MVAAVLRGCRRRKAVALHDEAVSPPTHESVAPIGVRAAGNELTVPAARRT
jgi:hypothetical protein